MLWLVLVVAGLAAGCCQSPSTTVVLRAPPSTPQQATIRVHKPPAQTTIDVQPAQTLGDGLDLQALGELVRQASNAAELEQMLNQEGGINNLDLNNDGVVDYISVNEFSTDATHHGFRFFVANANGTTTDVATVTIEKSGSSANVAISGSTAVYGPQVQTIRSNWDFADALIDAWLFGTHTVYVSPQPRLVMRRKVVSITTYRTVTTRTKAKRLVRKAPAAAAASAANVQQPAPARSQVSASPNGSANTGVLAAIKAALTNPTGSQKGFERRDRSQSTDATAFDDPATTAATASASAPKATPTGTSGGVSAALKNMLTNPTGSQKGFEMRDRRQSTDATAFDDPAPAATKPSSALTSAANKSVAAAKVKFGASKPNPFGGKRGK